MGRTAGAFSGIRWFSKCSRRRLVWRLKSGVRHQGRDCRLWSQYVSLCNKTGQWPTLFLTFPLLCGCHFITLHYSTLLGTFFLTLLCMCVCALWWQVVISLSRLLCGIRPQWLCGPYHDLLCVWELLSCHSLSVRTVVTPFSILWESSMTCAVRTLWFSFMLTRQLYLCVPLHYPILYFGAAALLYSMCALLYTTLSLAVAILYLYADVAIA